jgi:hypothetical protein
LRERLAVRALCAARACVFRGGLLRARLALRRLGFEALLERRHEVDHLRAALGALLGRLGDLLRLAALTLRWICASRSSR